MTWAVRPAAFQDAADIAAVHIRAWQQTYARLVEPGELDGFSVERRAERWGGIFEDERNGFVCDGADESVPLVRTPIRSFRMVR